MCHVVKKLHICNVKDEVRLYVLAGLGFALAIIGLLSPPIGEIGNSVIIMAGQFLVLAGGVAGCIVRFDFKNLYFHIGKHDNKDEKDSNSEN